MLRLLRIFVLISLLAALAAWLANHPGVMALDWQGYRIETSFVVLVSGVVLAFAAVFGLLRMWGWLRGPASAKPRRGLAAIVQGMTAIAMGNAGAARSHAAQADRLLGTGPLTLLLRAQAAQLAGEEADAGGHYAAMTALPDGELLGIRGLLGQALQRGDIGEARRLLVRAAQLSPKSRWVNQTRFALECSAGDWTAANQALGNSHKTRLIGKAEYDRSRGVLALVAAKQADAAGQHATALEHALEAMKHAPALAPASALAARLLAGEGKTRRAAKLIEAAWQHSPHPELAAIYAELEPGESAIQRQTRFGKLIAINPEHPESRSLRALRWQDGPLTATPAMWICAACNRRDAEWRAVCPECGGFDTAHWRVSNERHERHMPPAHSRESSPKSSPKSSPDTARIVIFEPPASPDDPGPLARD